MDGRAEASQPGPMPPLLAGKRPSRVDILAIKSRIEQLVGHERAQCYYLCLNKFLAQKLGKQEFDALCSRTLGSKGVLLHNQLIRGILRNACIRGVPPPPAMAKPSVVSGAKTGLLNKCINQGAVLAPEGSMQCNGDHMPPPGRSSKRDGHLVPNGREEGISVQPPLPHGVNMVVHENGTLAAHERKKLKRLRQHEMDELTLAKQPRLDKQPFTEEGLMHHKDLGQESGGYQQHETNEPTLAKQPSLDKHPMTEEGLLCHKDLGHDGGGYPVRDYIDAPLGIPFCSASIGGARKPSPPVVNNGDNKSTSCYEHGGLLPIDLLRSRMANRLAAELPGGVTQESAEVLNQALEIYMKRLISSCTGIARSRVQAEDTSGDASTSRVVTVGDMRVAAELQPQQLGPDWPVHLATITFRHFDLMDSPPPPGSG